MGKRRRDYPWAEEVAKPKGKKPDLAVEKHQIALAGTGFEDCAICPGCSGKVEDGIMLCSRAGARPMPVTAMQAKCCDGKKPPPYHKQQKTKRMRVQKHHQHSA